MPAPLQDALSFSSERSAKLPIGNKVSFHAKSGVLNLAKTGVLITTNSTFDQIRVVSFKLQPATGSYINSLYIPAKFKPLSIIINDEEFHFEPDRLYHGHHAFICFTSACSQQQFSLVFDRDSSNESIELLMSSIRPGSGLLSNITDLRPENAQPYNRGDTRTNWWKLDLDTATQTTPQ